MEKEQAIFIKRLKVLFYFTLINLKMNKNITVQIKTEELK